MFIMSMPLLDRKENTYHLQSHAERSVVSENKKIQYNEKHDKVSSKQL